MVAMASLTGGNLAEGARCTGSVERVSHRATPAATKASPTSPKRAIALSRSRRHARMTATGKPTTNSRVAQTEMTSGQPSFSCSVMRISSAPQATAT
jgi:hypothetical protein